MAWSGTGTFSRATGTSGWADDEAADIGITSARHDNQENELATGINACLAKNGENTATGNLPMGGFIHTNVGLATARTHYGRASQIQDSVFIYGGTTGGAANVQTMTLSPAITAYLAGQAFIFIAGFTNTAASPTLNVNGVGAKTIKRCDNTTCQISDIIVGGVYYVVYDGTNFQLLNPTPGLQTWTPTLTGSGSMAINAQVISYAKFRIIGKFVDFILRATFTTATSADKEVLFPLPLTAAANNSISFYAQIIDTSATPTSASSYQFSTTNGSVLRYDSANWSLGTLREIRVSGRYEIA